MTPARFGERFLALLLDLLLLVFLYLGGIAAMLAAGTPGRDVPRLLLFCAAYAVFAAYESFLLSKRGATPGKLALGLAVVDEKGGKPTASAAFVRTLGYIPSSFLNLGFLWALRGGRAWHDLIAGTRVVQTREKSLLARRLIAAGAWVTGLALAAVWAFAIVAPRFEDVGRVADAERALKVLSQLEDAGKKERGAYTDDVRQLAAMTGDADGFLRDLSIVCDLPAGFTIDFDATHYRILAHARDRSRTPVSIEGPLTEK